MSVHPFSWVLRNSEETLGRRLVLLVLADHAKDDGTCAWPSVATISREARLSRRPVQEALRKLEESGAIVPTGKSRSGTTIYTVVCPLNPGGAESAPGAEDDVEGARISTEGALLAAPDPSLEQPSGTRPSAAGPPKLVKIDGRNLGYDALVEVCEIAEGSPRLRSIPAALNGSRETGPGIRRMVWERVLTDTGRAEIPSEEFEKIVAAEIRRRAPLYRARFKDAEMTPTALAKWFLDLKPARSRPASDTVEEVLHLPEVSEEERRANLDAARALAASIGRAVGDG